MEYGVILAGGSGTRLWPLSRESMPKQLLPIIGGRAGSDSGDAGRSLLRLSFERLRAVIPPERIYVCTSAAHGLSVLADLPELPPENLLGEPEGRDTANAVGFPAAVLHKRDPDAVFAAVTADHVIRPVEAFASALRTAFRVVADRPRTLVTFGITPSHGHTGLGYIHRGRPIAGIDGAFRVQAFREKPDKPTADRYVESGNYYWNSGMFVWRADAVLNQLRGHLSRSYIGLSEIAAAWGTADQDRVLRRVYPTLPKISIDYAVMEPAAQAGSDADAADAADALDGSDGADGADGSDHDAPGAHDEAPGVTVVEMPVEWLDVGSWPALAETLPVDEHDNAVSADSLVQLDSDGNIVVCRDGGHLITLIGVTDTVVIHTPDATLVCPKSEAQRVKDLVATIRQRYGGKYC